MIDTKILIDIYCLIKKTNRFNNKQYYILIHYVLNEARERRKSSCSCVRQQRTPNLLFSKECFFNTVTLCALLIIWFTKRHGNVNTTVFTNNYRN